MKIGPMTEAVNLEKAVPSDAQPGASSSKPVPPVEEIDRVELSPAARLNETESEATGVDVRPEKVTEIRRAIEAGEFRVNPNDIADRMISEAASLLESIARQNLEVNTEQVREEPTSVPKPDKRG